MYASFFLLAGLAFQYGEALKCYQCKYLSVDSVESGDSKCKSPSADTATVTCPGNSGDWEYKCLIEDVSYTLETARYVSVSRGCAAFPKDTPTDPVCSSDKTTKLWQGYGQYKGTVSAGLANFLNAVKTISGNVCACTEDTCNRASGHVTGSVAAILVAALVGQVMKMMM